MVSLDTLDSLYCVMSINKMTFQQYIQVPGVVVYLLKYLISDQGSDSPHQANLAQIAIFNVMGVTASPVGPYYYSHLAKPRLRPVLCSWKLKSTFFSVSVDLPSPSAKKYYDKLDNILIQYTALALHPGYGWSWFEETWADQNTWINKAKAMPLRRLLRSPGFTKVTTEATAMSILLRGYRGSYSQLGQHVPRGRRRRGWR
ncbi:uncharacterized protein BCR38DRAFT_406989 [Pseudomassariella vexata]|uniref:Uncharacterized protein n=1 Tax=Pseudomassariella vexata TaxID=1141098 RepID=A0A1Y2E6R1_9PEZI|nr:uncharacterized protein BCR38DRAFT_406989 [Pseudomassariella vexata]ORY66966.1 hypothetical protein BCR38DRAFT_406989 [Pseudomassariella vexata]